MVFHFLVITTIVLLCNVTVGHGHRPPIHASCSSATKTKGQLQSSSTLMPPAFMEHPYKRKARAAEEGKQCSHHSPTRHENQYWQVRTDSVHCKCEINDKLLQIRGGASSSSYDDNYYGSGGGNYGSGYSSGGGGNDGGYNDDYYNRDADEDYYGRKDHRRDSSSSTYSDRDGYRGDEYGRNRYYDEDGRSSRGYYDDEGRYREDYDDRGSSRRRPSNKSNLPTVLRSGNRKIGIIFLSSGAAISALGITLFFNKTLMRLGNLLFVCGVPLMIGPGRTVGYFLQPKKARATGCLAFGIFLVLVGHPVLGILLEVFGLLNLFGNMFPLVMMMARQLPVVGGLFGESGGGKNGRKERRRRDSYEEDGYYERDGYYTEKDYRQEERY